MGEAVMTRIAKDLKTDLQTQLVTPEQTQLIAHCSLLTAHCSLLTAHCSLLTAYCLLLTAYCLLLTAYCLLWCRRPACLFAFVAETATPRFILLAQAGRLHHKYKTHTANFYCIKTLAIIELCQNIRQISVSASGGAEKYLFCW
jgi:hypothetical protein